jgi:hypothetical protein
MRRWRIGAALALALAGSGWSSAQAAAPDWRGLDWLMGAWTADGGGAQQGTGGFSFARDAGGQVVVRKNFADYPAQGGRPAERHDDLMVIFREGAAERAIYWDSEGHIIHYALAEPAPGRVVFESDDPDGPKYRITYRQTPAGLEGAFEIAPDRQRFNRYLTWTAHHAR